MTVDADTESCLALGDDEIVGIHVLRIPDHRAIRHAVLGQHTETFSQSDIFVVSQLTHRDDQAIMLTTLMIKKSSIASTAADSRARYRKQCRVGLIILDNVNQTLAKDE